MRGEGGKGGEGRGEGEEYCNDTNILKNAREYTQANNVLVVISKQLARPINIKTIHAVIITVNYQCTQHKNNPYINGCYSSTFTYPCFSHLLLDVIRGCPDTIDM